MKNRTLYLLLIFFVSCNQNTKTSKTGQYFEQRESSVQKENKENSSVEHWYKLSIIENEECIYHPISALNATITIDDNTKKIHIQYGIEDTEYRINKTVKNNDTRFYYVDNCDIPIICKMLSMKKAEWTVFNNINYTMTNDMLEILNHILNMN